MRAWEMRSTSSTSQAWIIRYRSLLCKAPLVDVVVDVVADDISSGILGRDVGLIARSINLGCYFLEVAESSEG